MDGELECPPEDRGVTQDFTISWSPSPTGRCQQIDAIEINESRQHGRVRFCYQPFACVVTLKGRLCQRGTAVQEPSEGLLARPVFAFNGSEVQMRRHGSVQSFSHFRSSLEVRKVVRLK